MRKISPSVDPSSGSNETRNSRGCARHILFGVWQCHRRNSRVELRYPLLHNKHQCAGISIFRGQCGGGGGEAHTRPTWSIQPGGVSDELVIRPYVLTLFRSGSGILHEATPGAHPSLRHRKTVLSRAYFLFCHFEVDFLCPSPKVSLYVVYTFPFHFIGEIGSPQRGQLQKFSKALSE